MKRYIGCAGVILLVLGAAAVQAATLNVGPGRPYTTIQAAINAAANGDTILVDSGTYLGSAGTMLFNGPSNITVKGNGPTRPVLDMGPDHSVSVWGKGICAVTTASSDITFESLEFKNAAGRDIPPWNDTGHNGSAVRWDGSVRFTMRNCYVHDCEEGVLVTTTLPTEILFEYCEFNHNGYGQGSTHNMYIGGGSNPESFTLRYCYVHRANVGHEVKTRAKKNYILYNRIMNEADGTASYEVDVPNGGETYLIGNIIQQGPNTTNGGMIQYAEEGATNPDQHLYVINNTVSNERNNTATGGFIRYMGTLFAVVTNNLFLGELEGNIDLILNGPGLETSNVLCNVHYNNGGTSHGPCAYLVSPGAPNYNYHLTAQSVVALNAGTPPGVSFNGYPLTPIYEYLHPCNFQARPVVGAIDIGAYEYSTNPTVDAGADQTTCEGNPVALHATASDPNSLPLTYAWTQTAGKNVALAGANTADASFTAPTVATVAQASLTFRITVSNTQGGQASDTVNVRVYLRGDVDHGDSVDVFDVIKTINAFGSVPGSPKWNAGADFDGNGVVDVFDVIAVVNNFGRSIQ